MKNIRILVLLSVVFLSGCMISSISPNETLNLALAELNIQELSVTKHWNENSYSSYITYDISTYKNFYEKTVILQTYSYPENTYLKYDYVNTDVLKKINQKLTKWYTVTSKGVQEVGSPMLTDNIFGLFKEEFLNSKFGSTYYPEEYEQCLKYNADGYICYAYIDINGDNENDLISYLVAPWIQGTQFNITIQINISETKDTIVFENDIFLNSSDEEGGDIISIYLLPCTTNGLYDILVENLRRETGESKRIKYSFDGQLSYCPVDEVLPSEESGYC